MIRRPPRSTPLYSSAASDVYKRQVGLCSYLLIGFWYEKQSASDAGKKAFVVNRIGDFGFLLGVFLIFWTFGSVNFTEVFPLAAKYPAGSGVITAITLCLFLGATGKSAQLPLY